VTLPAGFERLLLGHAIAVARADLAPNVRQALVAADGSRATLHQYAAQHPKARPLQGRGAAYAVPLPQSTMRVVVRHNRHGGLFAPLTGDRFFAPTRAPMELDVSLALARAGVPTPEVLAYAVYPPGGVLQRSDVCSREIADGRDLADVLVAGADGERAEALIATARLVALLSRAGARHHDLNAKNVLVTRDRAWVLDVDRVVLGLTPADALAGNLARLGRSLRKWRDSFGAKVSESDIAALAHNSAAR
jgi:hypothetical protein